MDLYTELDFDITDDDVEPCKRDAEDESGERTAENVCGGHGSWFLPSSAFPFGLHSRRPVH